MGVAKEAPARPQPQQDLERLELLEDVLPEVRLARAAVDVTVAVDPAELGQGSQVASARRGEHRLGPASGGGRVRIEPVEYRRVQHRLVVIAQHGFGAHRPEPVDHRVRVGSIADRIAEHEDSVDGRHRREHGVERLEIAVDVGEQREGRPAARLRRRRVRGRR